MPNVFGRFAAGRAAAARGGGSYILRAHKITRAENRNQFTDVRGSQPPLADASAATHATQSRDRTESAAALALESAGEELAEEAKCACMDGARTACGPGRGLFYRICPAVGDSAEGGEAGENDSDTQSLH